MELATLNLDTYKVIKLLQEKGYTKKAAEGFIAAIQEITLSGVATKQDIQDVRGEIQHVKECLKAEIQEVRNEVKDLEIKIMKALSDNLRFQLLQTIAIIGVMVALLTYFPG